MKRAAGRAPPPQHALRSAVDSPARRCTAFRRLCLPLWMPRFLDISTTGALVRCRCQVRLDDRASIRLVLDGEPFVAGVSVSRVVASATGDAETTYAGVAFVDQDEQSICVLRRFLTSRR